MRDKFIMALAQGDLCHTFQSEKVSKLPVSVRENLARGATITCSRTQHKVVKQEEGYVQGFNILSICSELRDP